MFTEYEKEYLMYLLDEARQDIMSDHEVLLWNSIHRKLQSTDCTEPD